MNTARGALAYLRGHVYQVYTVYDSLAVGGVGELQSPLHSITEHRQSDTCGIAPTPVSTSACPPQTFNIIQTVVDHQPNFFLQHH